MQESTMTGSYKYFVLLLALLVSGECFSCSCLQFDLADKYSNAKHVYIAKLNSAIVKNVSDSKLSYVEGNFQVIEIYKGNPKQVMKLKTGMGGGDCGIPMTIARKYIIFQSNNEYIGICDGSTTLNVYDADELAKRLHSL